MTKTNLTKMASLGLLGLALLGRPASAAPPIEVVIANEHLNPEFAEQNLAAFLRRLEEVGRLPKESLRGKVFVRPREALPYIRQNKVPFAILPTHQFLEGRKDLGFEVLARAVGLEGSDPAYWGITRNEPRPYSHIELHPGLRLAVTEAYDPQWLDVLFEGNVDASQHFKVTEVANGREAVASLLARKVDVALVYETDFRPLKPRIEGKTDLAWVYTSADIPPPAVVATRWASKGHRKRMSAAVAAACKGEGGAVCGRMAIMYFEPGRAETYRNMIQKYETY